MIAFAMFGLDDVGTTYLLIAIAIGLVYFLVYGWQFTSRVVKDGYVRYRPKNLHIEHMGYPAKVLWLDEYDFVEINKGYGIYDSKGLAHLQDGTDIEISLRSLQPSSWQTLTAGLRDKRIWRVRTLTDIEKQNEWLLESIKEVRIKLLTLEEELRAERGSNEQNMQRFAETAKTLREHLAPPQAFFPNRGYGMGRNSGVTLNLEQQGQKEGGT